MARLTREIVIKEDIPQDPDNGFVNIVVLDDDTVEQIMSKASTTQMSEENSISADYDEYTRVNLTAEKCLRGWGNLFDESGEEIKFNTKEFKTVSKLSIWDSENKEFVRFFKWVDQKHTKAREQADEERKKALGN